MLDYARFHLGDGTGRDGKPVLTRASLVQMRTTRASKAGTDDEMGLGWHLRKVGGVITASQGGTLEHNRTLCRRPRLPLLWGYSLPDWRTRIWRGTITVIGSHLRR